MSEKRKELDPDKFSKEVSDSVSIHLEPKTLPRCDRCGSQLRTKDGKCICERFFMENKE